MQPRAQQDRVEGFQQIVLGAHLNAVRRAFELVEPDRQLLPSMEKVVENGFLLGLQEGLRRAYSARSVGSAEKKPTELHTGK